MSFSPADPADAEKAAIYRLDRVRTALDIDGISDACALLRAAVEGLRAVPEASAHMPLLESVLMMLGDARGLLTEHTDDGMP